MMNDFFTDFSCLSSFHWPAGEGKEPQIVKPCTLLFSIKGKGRLLRRFFLWHHGILDRGFWDMI
jgi:hypothetical protein